MFVKIIIKDGSLSMRMYDNAAYDYFYFIWSWCYKIKSNLILNILLKKFQNIIIKCALKTECPKLQTYYVQTDINTSVELFELDLLKNI